MYAVKFSIPLKYQQWWLPSKQWYLSHNINSSKLLTKDKPNPELIKMQKGVLF